MACLDMFNTDTHQRISFSNDFVDTPQSLKHNSSSRSESQSPVASEFFEFSVSKYTMMPADELFFQGTLLPFKKTTLRDELLMEDEEDEEEVSTVRPPKVPTKWKEFWGLKKAHIVTKKADKMSDLKGDTRSSKISQELIADKESMDRDVEMKL
ncbi:hypothetical protein ACHQM5_021669 [Ranunculus cassubicifolius]